MSDSSPWKKYETKDGEIYYYNTITDESSWNLPSEEISPLPEHWIECTDNDGYLYFFNELTHESVWERPSTAEDRKQSLPTKSLPIEGPGSSLARSGVMKTSSTTNGDASSHQQDRDPPMKLENLGKKLNSLWSVTKAFAKSTLEERDQTASRPPPPPKPKGSSSGWAVKSQAIDSNNTASKSKDSSSVWAASCPESSNGNEEEKTISISWPDTYHTRQLRRGPKMNISSEIPLSKSSSCSTSTNSKNDDHSASHSKGAFKGSALSLRTRKEDSKDQGRIRKLSLDNEMNASGCSRCGADVRSRFCTACGFDIEKTEKETISRGQYNSVNKLTEKNGTRAAWSHTPKSSSGSNDSDSISGDNCGVGANTGSKQDIRAFHKDINSLSNSPSSSLIKPTITLSDRTTHDFASYMRQCDVSDSLIRILEEEKVTFENMLKLDHEALKEFGISAWGDRMKILNAIANYKTTQSACIISAAAPPAAIPTPTTQPVSSLSPSPVLNSTYTEAFVPPSKLKPLSLNKQLKLNDSVVQKDSMSSKSSAVALNPSSKDDASTIAVTEPKTIGWNSTAKTKDSNKKTSGWAVRSVGKSNELPNSPEMIEKQKQEELKRKEEERKKQEEKRRREKEAFAKEEEYVKTREGQSQLEQIRQKKIREEQLLASVDPSVCSAEFHIVKYDIQMKGKKPDFVTYRIEVYYWVSSWIINRRFKQFLEMDKSFQREISGYTPCLPVMDTLTPKFDSAFLKDRQQKLDEYLQIVCNSRPAIFASNFSALHFMKFIAPVQYGDVKGPNFILPFKLVL